MSCRRDILAALPLLLGNREDQTFTAAEVAAFMRAWGSTYCDLTIRHRVTHFMCASMPDPFGTRSQDLERVGPGRYRLLAAQQRHA